MRSNDNHRPASFVRASARRADRLRRRVLARELAVFSSASDRLEIDLIIDRYPAEQTSELRQILAQQSV